MKKYLLLLLIPFALSLAACSMSGRLYKQGQVAYQQQNYHTAFQKLLKAAQHRNINAMYSVGYMYYYGIGTRKNMPEAIKWMQKAANKGQPQAKQAMEVIDVNMSQVQFMQK